MKIIRIIFITIIVILLSLNIAIFGYQAYHKYTTKNDLINRIDPNNILVYIQGDIHKIFEIPKLKDTDFFEKYKDSLLTILKYNDSKQSNRKEIAIIKDNSHEIHILAMFPYHIEFKDNINISFKYIGDNTAVALNPESIKLIDDTKYNYQNIMDLKTQILSYNNDNLTIYINYSNIFEQLVYNTSFSDYNIKFYPGILSPFLRSMKNGIYSLNFTEQEKIHFRLYNDFNLIDTLSKKFNATQTQSNWIKYMNQNNQFIIKSYDLKSTIDNIKKLNYFSDNLNLNLQIIDNAIKKTYDLTIDEITELTNDDFMILQTASGGLAFFTQYNENIYNKLNQTFKKSLIHKSYKIDKIILEDGKIVNSVISNADTISEKILNYSGANITSFSLEGSDKYPSIVKSDNVIFITSDLDTATQIIDTSINNSPVVFKDYNITYENYFYINTETFDSTHFWVFGEHSTVIQELFKTFKIISYGKTSSVSEVFGEGMLIYNKKE